MVKRKEHTRGTHLIVIMWIRLLPNNIPAKYSLNYTDDRLPVILRL